MAGGRPTDYKPEYCDMLIEHMGQGLSFSSFASDLNVAESTIYLWAQLHSEFSEAKKIGRGRQRVYYERKGVQSDNPAIFIWMTKNMLGWREPKDLPQEENTEALDQDLRDILAKDQSER